MGRCKKPAFFIVYTNVYTIIVGNDLTGSGKENSLFFVTQT